MRLQQLTCQIVPAVVSNTVMRVRWRVVLPTVGLLLFAGLTYDSVRTNREVNNSAGRYFWWLTLRLDSEPGSSQLSTSCNGANADCANWDAAYLWVDIGWLARTLIFSAFPAFLVGGTIVGGFRRLGVSEIISFMISMPLLIAS
jgi:hypothetical protein